MKTARILLPATLGILAGVTEATAGTSLGFLGGAVLMLGAALTIPWTARTGWANCGFDLGLIPGCGALGLLAVGVDWEQAVRVTLVLVAWVIVLRGLLGLGRLVAGEYAARALASAAGAFLVAMPLVWPEAVTGAGGFISPTIWLLDFACQLDWARAPGFYELLGDKYLGAQSDATVWIWLGVAIALDRAADLHDALRATRDRQRTPGH